jgi:hypothetical protein
VSNINGQMTPEQWESWSHVAQEHFNIMLNWDNVVTFTDVLESLMEIGHIVGAMLATLGRADSEDDINCPELMQHAISLHLISCILGSEMLNLMAQRDLVYFEIELESEGGEDERPDGGERNDVP